jgi:hypothetical protein
MKMYATVVDDFLSDFSAAREWADTATFKDTKNPTDGVVYPLIANEMPTSLKREIEMNLMLVVGTTVYPRLTFMRLSPAGVYVPHQAHTDVAMGQWSMMLYMNRPEHCTGGTSILHHINGMDRHPVTDEDVAIWKEDMNDESRWQITDFCRMQSNRAFIFRSDLFHRAEPSGGFGRGPRNGRLVCTCFFNTVNHAAG